MKTYFLDVCTEAAIDFLVPSGLIKTDSAEEAVFELFRQAQRVDMIIQEEMGSFN